MESNHVQTKYSNISQPMWKMVYHQFCNHKLASYSSLLITLFIAIALSADLISLVTDLDPYTQNVSARFSSPLSKIEISQDSKDILIEQYIQNEPTEAKELAKTLKIKNIVVTDDDTTTENLNALNQLAYKTPEEIMTILNGLPTSSTLRFQALTKRFQKFHLFGTDEVGRDILIRLIYGARVSLGVGLLVALTSALLGLIVGGLAGYYGGYVDMILMRFTDSMISLPTIPTLIVFSAIDLKKLPLLSKLVSENYESVLKMFIIMCLFSWMTIARLIRGSILSMREREFILAAKALGAGDFTILIRHLLPNIMAPALVSLTLGIGSSIIYESALSFLGMGISPPIPSWGSMLNNAQEVIYKNPWLTILPGLMIFLTTVSFNFIGDGLQDAIDPKSIRR